MTSTTVITLIRKHDKVRVVHEEKSPKQQKEPPPQQHSYDLRPLKTFLLLKGERNQTKVVDYYIIRECTQNTESVRELPGPEHEEYDSQRRQVDTVGTDDGHQGAVCNAPLQ